MRYGIRTDPVLKMKLPDETIVDPDPPGQFPILSVKDFLDARNPYFIKNHEILKSENKDLASGKYFLDPNLLNDKDRKELAAILEKMFGSSAHPTVGGLEESERDLLKLSDATLAEGSKLYRLHCLHCHGKTGDGRGPTAPWVNPHPRDFRQGIFKFESVDQTSIRRPPHRDDLMRILEVGIEGTSMPSYELLPADKREAIVSYVIHLSLRGRAEYRFFTEGCKINASPDRKDTYKLTFEDPSGNLRPLGQYLAELHKGDPNVVGDSGNVGAWVDSQSSRIKVVAYPYASLETEEGRKQMKDSAQRGQEMFRAVQGDKACAICHKDFGRQAMFRFDEWGTLTRPNNLTLGVFRGGRRRVDIYYRIHSGIGLSGMPAFGESKIWDLVNFVQVVSDPMMRKALGIQ